MMRTLYTVYWVLLSYHATVITGSISGLVDLEIDLIQFTNPSGLNIQLQQCQHGPNCTLGNYGFQYCVEDQNLGESSSRIYCKSGWNDIGYIATVNNTVDFLRNSGNWHNPLVLREQDLQFFQLKFHFYVNEISASGTSYKTDVVFMLLQVDADSTVLSTLSISNLTNDQNPNATLALNVSLTCSDHLPLAFNSCNAAPFHEGLSNLEAFFITYSNPTGTLSSGKNCTAAGECNIGITTCYETPQQMSLQLTHCVGTSVIYRSITNQSNSIDFLSSTQCNNNSLTVNCTEFDNPLHYIVQNFTAIRVKITVYHYPQPIGLGQPIDNFVFDVWALDHQINSSYLLHLTGLRQQNPTNLLVGITLCSGIGCGLPIPTPITTSTQTAPSSASSQTTSRTTTTTSSASLTKTTSRSTQTASSSTSTAAVTAPSARTAITRTTMAPTTISPTTQEPVVSSEVKLLATVMLALLIVLAIVVVALVAVKLCS